MKQLPFTVDVASDVKGCAPQAGGPNFSLNKTTMLNLGGLRVQGLIVLVPGLSVS